MRVERDSRLNLIFIGRSGSGKGTQADLMEKFLKNRDGEGSVFRVYPGKHFRRLISNYPNTETGKFLDAKMVKAGNKSPDFLTAWVWAQEFIFNVKPNQHVIFDGTPRTLIEAKILDELLDFYERKNVKPILIGLSPEEAKKRLLLRGREDDTERQIKNRLLFYEKHVVPVIRYYRYEKNKNKLFIINGNIGEPELIHEKVLKAIGLVGFE